MKLVEKQNTFRLTVVTFQFALIWLLIVIKKEYPLSNTVMSIALLDELLFWMRCRQLWRKAREAAERLIVVLEELNYMDSQQESRPFV